ncbi:conserved hypothetical protein [Candidatus Desulfosporosinus infrequens]|uniref:HDOD domain-containing protein n=1 Tax=Candidatus Desulfosporosinus infrequens TaxID=2043169 RepID=A0A2U3LAY4_9FIRM|nr:conserved hypothetical protein [Candidatus Desulfosporosinus infrequens]
MPVKLEHVLRHVRDLPALSETAMRVIDLTKDPETSAKELELVIRQDLALTAGMLRQANSAYYGYERRISSLQEAIVLLGLQVIQGIAMSAAVAPLLKLKLVGYDIDQEGLWKHSLLTAIAAKQLCRYRKLPYGDVAFVAGLLHDIGKLIITIYLQEIGDYMLKKVTQSKVPYVEFEEIVIGYNHATVGGFLAKAWNLPEDLVEAISYHHAPLKAQNHTQLASVIHVANGMVSLVGVVGGVDSFFNPIQPEVLDLLELKESDLKLLMAELDKYLVDPDFFN